jgi:hypothetical protein
MRRIRKARATAEMDSGGIEYVFQFQYRDTKSGGFQTEDGLDRLTRNDLKRLKRAIAKCLKETRR